MGSENRLPDREQSSGEQGRDRALDIGRNWTAAHRASLVRVLAIVIGVVLWQAYTATQPSYLFPGLEQIIGAFLQQLSEGLLGAYLYSMVTLFTGVGLALLVGVSLGLAMGLNSWGEAVLNPYVNGLYVAPVVALVPVLIVVGGASFWTRVVVVFLFAVFEIAIDTYEGVKATPDAAIDAVRSFGADTAFVVRHVIVPYDLPYIFTGIRLGLGRGIKGMIIAELIFDFANLGAIIRTWADNFRLDGVFSVVVLLMLTGIVLTRGLALLERHLIDWEVEPP